MARKEEETPAYVDYGETAESASDWAGKDLTTYFEQCLGVTRKISAPVNSIKDKSLAKRTAKLYNRIQCQQMVDYWVRTAPVEHVAKFNLFYVNKDKIAERLFSRDFGWDN